MAKKEERETKKRKGLKKKRLKKNFKEKKAGGEEGGKKEESIFLLSAAVKWISYSGRAGREQISASLRSLQVFLPFMKPRDATHILFVQHKQTDCKLADNFCTDNVIYSCQPFVCHVCFIQI